MIIGKQFKLDAAHFLPCYEGKCKNMHGHTWKIDVQVEGEVQVVGPYRGMVFDLNMLTSAVQSVIGKFDHQTLNKFLDDPTCECLAMSIALHLQEYLPPGVTVYAIMVQEGEGGYAIWLK